MQIAMAGGGPIGGWVSDRFTWRAVFYAQVPLGLISAIAAYLSIRESGASRCHARFPNGTSLFRSSSTVIYALVALSMTAFFFTASGVSSSASLSGAVPLSIVLAGVLAVLGLVYACFTAEKSSVLIRYMKSMNIRSTLLLTCVSSLVHQAILYNVPLFATSVNQVSATIAGAYMTPVSVAAVLATVVAGLRISRSGKYKRTMLLGAFFTTLGPVSFMAISIFAARPPLDIILEVLSSFPSTFGSQLLNAILIVVLLASSEAGDIAGLTSYSARGYIYTFLKSVVLLMSPFPVSKSLGGVIGTALSGLILESLLTSCRKQELQYDGTVNVGPRT